MSKIKGKNIAVYVNGSIQAFATQAEIDVQWEMREISNGSVKKYIPWKMSWSISSSHFVSDKKWRISPTLAITGTQVTVAFKTVFDSTDNRTTAQYVADGKLTLTGNGYIKRMTISGQNKAFAQMNMEIQGSGTLAATGSVITGTDTPD